MWSPEFLLHFHYCRWTFISHYRVGYNRSVHLAATSLTSLSPGWTVSVHIQFFPMKVKLITGFRRFRGISAHNKETRLKNWWGNIFRFQSRKSCRCSWLSPHQSARLLVLFKIIRNALFCWRWQTVAVNVSKHLQLEPLTGLKLGTC